MDRPVDKAARRRLQPEARKREIVEAAERLLQAHGDQVRVEDVVREAGVAKGTFFLYFPSWDDLLITIRDRLVAEFEATYALPTEAEGPVDWPAVLDDLARVYIDFAAARQGIGRALFHSDFTERRPLGISGVQQLAAVIRAGQEAGAFAPVDPDPTARLLFSALDEAARAVAAGDDRAATLGALQTLVRRALAP